MMEKYEEIELSDDNELLEEQNNEIEQFDAYDEFDEALEEDEDDEKELEDKKKHTKKGQGKSMDFEVSVGGTILEFMFENVKTQSKTTIRSYLKNRQVTINGIPTTQFDDRVMAGDNVSINLGLARITLTHSMLDIIYEDDYLLVVNKRNGLLTMGTDRERKRTAYYILGEYLKAQDSKNRIFIVHRLDRETSGLVIFAKSMEVQHRLQQNWSDMVLERKYVAVVSGCPEPKEGEVRSYLKENKAFVVYSSRYPEDGELAITRYKVLKSSKSKSLVELELETGRKNQIRVHMKDLGCPIVGDKKYGGEDSFINRVTLHANRIKFIHPVTNEEMLFDTGIPGRFNKVFFFK